jgi:hypothetical protein
MAYNLTEEKILEHMINDPTWTLFYHREKVERMLPSLAQAYRLIGGLMKELEEKIKSGEYAEKTPSPANFETVLNQIKDPKHVSGYRDDEIVEIYRQWAQSALERGENEHD